MIANPVMFVVEIVATLTTILFFRDLVTHAPHLGFALQINLWLWFTVLFANFAEAVAEGPRQGPGGYAAPDQDRCRRQTAWTKLAPNGVWSRPRSSKSATSFWWRPAISFRATAK